MSRFIPPPSRDSIHPSANPCQMHNTCHLMYEVSAHHSHQKPIPQLAKKKDQPDKVFALPNHTSATHCLRSSTSTHTSDARESGNLENKERVVGIDEKFPEEIAVAGEGKRVTKVPCTCSLPVQPIPNHEELIMMLARMLSSSMALWPISMAPYNFNPTLLSTTPTFCNDRSITPLDHLHNLYQYPAPHIADPVLNIHQGPTVSPPCLPVNMISHPSTCLSLKLQPKPSQRQPNTQNKHLRALPG